MQDRNDSGRNSLNAFGDMITSAPAGNPPAHGSEVLLVRTPESPGQGGLFVEEDEQMNEKEE
jgi:hypothetical protein